MALTAQFMSLGGMALGAIVGAYFGQPRLGMVIGGVVGGVLSSYLFKDKNSQNNEPPKLHENRVQISTYGTMIPMLWGTKRMAGNVIWMDEIKEVYTVNTSHTEGGSTVRDRTRTFTCSFAVAFCEGPISSIIRMWVDNVIFVDFRDPNGEFYPPGAGAEMAVANIDASSSLANQRYTLYYGAEDQAVDPTIEAALGAGNTPAYRGICYVVFRNFPIGEFGSIPNIEAELVKTGSTNNVQPSIDLNNVKSGGGWADASHPWTMNGNYVVCDRVNCTFYILNGYSETVLDVFTTPKIAAVSGTYQTQVSGFGISPVDGRLFVCLTKYGGISYYRRNLIYSAPGGELVYDSGDLTVNASTVPYPSYGVNFFFVNGQIWEHNIIVYQVNGSLEYIAGGANYFNSYRLYKSDGSYISLGTPTVFSCDGTYFYMKHLGYGINLGSGTHYYVLKINPALLSVTVVSGRYALVIP
jgi:hypothetical protein